MNLKEILDQAKQSIDTNKQFHPTVTLTTTFLEPAGKSNVNFQFFYGPHTILNRT